MQEDRKLSRREWLRFFGRVLFLGAGAAGGAVLLRRKQVVLSGQRCTNAGVCAGCRNDATCGLPQALSRRRAMQKEPA